MIGVISEWHPARNSGHVQPVDDGSQSGHDVHGGAFGNKPQLVGTRVVYTPWRPHDGRDFAVNVSPATAELSEVDRCLG